MLALMFEWDERWSTKVKVKSKPKLKGSRPGLMFVSLAIGTTPQQKMVETALIIVWYEKCHDEPNILIEIWVPKHILNVLHKIVFVY